MDEALDLEVAMTVEAKARAKFWDSLAKLIEALTAPLVAAITRRS